MPRSAAHTRGTARRRAEAIAGALADYVAGPADFSDYVIGQRNAHAGCEVTATFDRGLRGHPTFRVL